jgi:NAD(P)-dependent dehydrogenase (short-subunit alcohol dehydrogenase family)
MNGQYCLHDVFAHVGKPFLTESARSTESCWTRMKSFTMRDRRNGPRWLTPWFFVLGLNQGQSKQQIWASSAAKGAIVQLTTSMAIELAPHNIQVNAIAPGWIETDLPAPVRTRPLNDEILARTPAGRWVQPEELAGTAGYLASRASDFVTGTTIRVDGGYAIR